ncbi:MAG: membrane or secreted protein [Bacteroidota bacterium]
MSTFLVTLGLAIAFIGIGFAGIAVKILFKKNGEFSGTCASNSPFLNKEGEACSLCGALPDEKCKSDDSKRRDESEFSPFVA